MWPVHIDQKNHVFRVGNPVMYDPARPLEEQQDRLAEVLGCGLRGETVS